MSAPVVVDLSASRQRRSATAGLVLGVVGVLGVFYGLVGGQALALRILLIVIACFFLVLAAVQLFLVRPQRGRRTLALDLEARGLGFDDHGASGTTAVRWRVGWPELTSAAVVRQVWADSVGTGSRTALGTPTMPSRAIAPGYNPADHGTVVLDLTARAPLEQQRPALARFRVPADGAPRYRMGLGSGIGVAQQLAEGMQRFAPALFAGVHDEASSAFAAPQPVWDPGSRAGRYL